MKVKDLFILKSGKIKKENLYWQYVECGSKEKENLWEEFIILNTTTQLIYTLKIFFETQKSSLKKFFCKII